MLISAYIVTLQKSRSFIQQLGKVDLGGGGCGGVVTKRTRSVPYTFNRTLPPRCVVNRKMALVDESYGSDDPVKGDSSEEEGQIVDEPEEVNGPQNQR